MQSPLHQNPLNSRDDLAAAVMDMVRPLLPHFSSGCARVRLGETGTRHDTAAAELESFARPLWGIVPLAAGGFAFPHWELWRAGLANGTDPDHPEYWGPPADNDQRLVEMAAIGFALRLVPAHIWDPLSPDAKRNVTAYLQAAHRCTFANCNWKFFRLLIGLGLAETRADIDLALQDQYLEELDAYYTGEGWYYDGKPKQVDHYIPFAFHFYGLLYAQLTPHSRHAAKFRARARDISQGMRHWYADDGAALPFGRSLAYRFAHAGIWGAFAYAGQEVLPWGQVKGYYLRNLRWWAKQPIFDAAGLLTIGFAYPNLLMSEGYNGPGSPYWAMKAFLPLALPADHPFWLSHEADAPPAPDVTPLPRAAMVIQRHAGHQVALTSGQELGYMRHGAEKYAKFAYSTRYGFSVEVDERQFWQASSDNMLTLSDDGVHFRMRETNEEALLAGPGLYARWRPFGDVKVETWTLPAGPWHIRLHVIDTPRPLDVIEGGFSIARPRIGTPDIALAETGATIRSGSDVSVLMGQDHRTARAHLALPNSNVIFPRSYVPQLTGRVPAGVTTLSCAALAAQIPADWQCPARPTIPDVDSLRRQFETDGVAVPDLTAP